MTPPRSVAIFSVVVCLLGLAATRAAAQGQDSPEDTRPSFSLSTSAIVTSRETPAIYLTFRRLDHLDFRVYKVNDPMKFLAGLKDPHQLGSEEPIVSQVPTLLERVADWKSEWRWRVRNFFRTQFTWDYRHVRRQQMDQQTVVQRRTVNVNTFAQVPLLNPSQLVTSWREILPPLRDADVRRIPIDVKQPGMYVVEAVLPPHMAYTVVIVSDIGLVTQGVARAGAALRGRSEHGQAGERLRRAGAAQPEGARVGPDGRRRRPRRALRRSRDRRCGGGRDVRRPGDGDRSGQLLHEQPGPRAGRLHLHRQADLPAGTHGSHQGPAPLAGARRARAVRRAGRGSAHLRHDGQGDLPAAPQGGLVRRHHRGSAAVGRRRARRLLGRGARRRRHRERQLRSAGVPQARVRSPRHADGQVRRAGRRGARDDHGALLLRPARGRRTGRHGSRTASRTTRRCAGATKSRARAATTGGAARSRRSKAPRGSTPAARPTSASPSTSTSGATTTACASRRASPTRAAARSAASRRSTRRTARSSSRPRSISTSSRSGAHATLNVRAVDYVGAPQCRITIVTIDRRHARARASVGRSTAARR